MIDQVIINNYKSIRELRLPLRSLNVLIGSNGVGKSNFISFFELTKIIYEQNFGGFTMAKGIDSLLYNGRKVSTSIYGLLDFDNANAFYFTLKPTESPKGYIEQSGHYYNRHNTDSKNYQENWDLKIIDSNVEESRLKNPTDNWRLLHIRKPLNNFTVYHFHDTSSSSPMRGFSDINDNYALRHDGSNLAAYLYKLQKTDTIGFNLIEGTIRSIAPYFKSFKLQPNAYNPSQINLEWEEVGSDMYLNGHSFSDGTLRFIALATLLLQSELPSVIIIDEPELGLHPTAINKLAALAKRASKDSQIIISTQSTNLVNNFEVDDIITVDRADGQSVFNRLKAEDLSIWLDDYNFSVSDLWEKNIIGGQL